MEKLAHYNILEPLGTGSAGNPFRARDTVHGRTVLIRVIPQSIAGDPSTRARFLRDARAAATLSHPNIAALFEIGEDGPHLFLATEFVPGQSLRKVIGGRPVNVRNAIEIAVQLADALAEAHGQGFVHGRLRPEKVRVNPKGQSKILDFGLAAWSDGVTEPGPTGSDLDPYRSPERAGAAPMDARPDLLALGAVLFEMLTGRAPVPGTTAGIGAAGPPAPSTINPDVPPELDVIVLRVLANSPDDRYQGAASISAELRSVGAILDIRSGDREPPVARQIAVAPRRRSRVSGRLVALVLLAVAVGVMWWRGGDTIARLWQRYTGPPPAAVVMVMRFEVDDPRRRHWGDGLADDLATRLGLIPGLSVVSRSATRRDVGPAELGALQPGAVLRGTVRVRNGRASLHLSLLDARDRTPLWTGEIVTEVAEILAAETEIAEAIARRLALTLEPSAARARKKSDRVSEGAYDLYLRGRQEVTAGRPDRAVELYEQAIRDGEGFAEVYAALATALHRSLAGGLLAEPARAEARLREVASLAAAADPDLPEAALAQAIAAESLPDALGHARRALELDPSFADAYVFAARAVAEIAPERVGELLDRAAAFDASSSGVALEPVRAHGARDLDAAEMARLNASIASDLDALLSPPLP